MTEDQRKRYELYVNHAKTWPNVSAQSTRIIGNACHRGIDYNGASKGDVIRCVITVSYTHLTLPTKLEV